ncbi:recombinase family protein [Acidiphilium angustum]|uniref:recombinase family protein n=1 Tax=Acidiphilium angustum TaxID=523 RepID=UPI0009DDEC61|nr:recombinase family protein [Acidiphilium angustum]
MSSVFVHALASTIDHRPSTIDQSADNQVMEVKGAGFAIQAGRVVTETISGGAPAMNRPFISPLPDQHKTDDVLVVTKLDRLGPNALDVRATVDALAGLGVRLHCLSLGGVDLTSSAGRMTMQVIAAVADFERDLLIELAQAGLARARRTGKAIGRPGALTDDQKTDIATQLVIGAPVSALARTYRIRRQTINRTRTAASTITPATD